MHVPCFVHVPVVMVTWALTSMVVEEGLYGYQYGNICRQATIFADRILQVTSWIQSLDFSHPHKKTK